jgi:hypothetical protein
MHLPGERKIIISAQPTVGTSDLYKYYNLGTIFQWQWCCPNPDCKKHQPFYWYKEREDGTFGGFNFDDIRNDDDSRNIGASAKTTWLECFYCKHHVNDTPEERDYLNTTGKYVCIKADGDPEVHAYTWPQMVNVNMHFRDFTLQFLNAKYKKRITGDDEDLMTFKNQVLGEFYVREVDKDISKLLVEHYNPQEKWDKEGIRNSYCRYYAVGNDEVLRCQVMGKRNSGM